ncbi:hypothetical protein [Croceibacterium soli]
MRLGAALPLLLMAACSDAPDTPAPEPTPAPRFTPDKPRMLVPADLATVHFGGRIEGLEGPEVTGSFVLDGEPLAEMVSYVACPEAVTECDPAELPDGTVYTYVHRVTPAEGVENAAVFRTARKISAFANGVGFDRHEADAALGPGGKIDVSADNGALVWRVIGGDGWKAGETITFYWQSTMPPEEPRQAYQFEADGSAAIGSGPFPPREKPVQETASR